MIDSRARQRFTHARTRASAGRCSRDRADSGLEFKIMPTELRQPQSQTRSQSTAIPAAANDCVRRWVAESAEMCQPDRIVWLDGSKSEREALLEQGVREG